MAKKNGKEKAVTAAKQRERQPHPFGQPPERARGYTFPIPNPTLHAYAGKAVGNLPQNLQDVFAAVEKHKDGIALKDLKIPKLRRQNPGLVGPPVVQALLREGRGGRKTRAR